MRPTDQRIEELKQIIKDGIEKDGLEYALWLDWQDHIDTGVVTKDELEWCFTWFDVTISVSIEVASDD